jgi:hypothetical protein
LNCSGVSMSVADLHAKAKCRGRSGKSPAVIDAPLHPIEKDGALVGRDRRARPLVRPHGRCGCLDVDKRKNSSALSRLPSHFSLRGSQGGARPPSPTAAVLWSVRYRCAGRPMPCHWHFEAKSLSRCWGATRFADLSEFHRAAGFDGLFLGFADADGVEGVLGGDG